MSSSGKGSGGNSGSAGTSGGSSAGTSGGTGGRAGSSGSSGSSGNGCTAAGHVLPTGEIMQAGEVVGFAADPMGLGWDGK